jgi:hypothetical protein
MPAQTPAIIRPLLGLTNAVEGAIAPTADVSARCISMLAQLGVTGVRDSVDASARELAARRLAGRRRPARPRALPGRGSPGRPARRPKAVAVRGGAA